MNKLVITILLACLCFACNSSHSSKDSKDIPSDEETVEALNGDTIAVSDTIPIKEGRKLRYLFFANGGLIGYFDDGTVVGCLRCELLDVNVDGLYERKPFRTYSVRDDGSLLVGGTDIEYPREAGEDEFSEWAMIDYKWIIIPEKYEGE